MTDYLACLVAPLVHKYRSRGMIIDTNLMLIYIIGHCDIRYMGEFGHTRNYMPEDHEHISRIMSFFNKKVITPHVLTELSNLYMTVRKDKQRSCLRPFQKLLKATDENNIDKNEILEHPLLGRIGVTDLGIIKAAKQYGYLVFTDDIRMTGLAKKAGIDVLNFNHLRLTLGGMK